MTVIIYIVRIVIFLGGHLHSHPLPWAVGSPV